MNDREPQDIRRVLEHYGADGLPDSGGWRSIRCAFHGDRTPSASVSVRDGAFKCFVCGIKGDAIGVIRRVEGCDFITAANKYREITGSKLRGVDAGHEGRLRGFDLDGKPKSYEEGSGFRF